MSTMVASQIVLRRLRVTPLQVVFLTEEEWNGPRVKTPLLRSALGFHLRERECLTNAPRCEGCLQKRECWYAAAFESPAETMATDTLLHGDRRLPHPFYMAAGEMRQRLQPGTEMSCLLSLFGNPHPLLGKLLRSMTEAGESAKWGGGFRVERVVSMVDGLERIPGNEVASLIDRKNWPVWEIPAPQRNPRLNMRFITPLRLRIKGEVQSHPPFSEIVRALLRRIHLLVHLYSRIELEKGWGNELIDAARSVTTKAQWQFEPASRTSGSQGRRIPLDGWMGCLDLAGDDLPQLLPFLDAGRFIGIGSQTSHGFGCYQLESPDGDL